MTDKVISITAKGIVDGREGNFKAMRSTRTGKYQLSKSIGRVRGSRTTDAINNVFVDTLEEAAELLVQNHNGMAKYYIWLRYDGKGGYSRRQPFTLKTAQINWEGE